MVRNEANDLYYDYVMTNKTENAPAAVLAAVTPLQ